ncbi:DUF4123 domain-containing protein [Massilia sp. UMI-21]|nr:DUF4123 domain-containing protein [Massilia sp. UMI-21]
MYFASEPCKTRAVTRELAEKIREQPDLTWLALVDGAFDHGRAGLSLPGERHALYDHDGMSDLLAASPYLIVLTAHDAERLQRELTALVLHRKERPMLSFIGTSLSASAVNENFRLFAAAATDEGQEFLLRFADTRVLVGLPDSLRREYWDGMTCLLANWIVIDRDGQPRPLPLNANRASLQSRFQLSPAEFAKLVASSEPDAILDAIAEGNPEALPEFNRAAIYQKVADACLFAQRHKVSAFPDLVALAYLALLKDGKELQDPTLGDMFLRSEWVSGSLINHLVDFFE